MSLKSLHTTTVVEDIQESQLYPGSDPDEFTDVLMSASSQWSEYIEKIGDVHSFRVEAEDLGVQRPPNVNLRGDIVACFVLDAVRNQLITEIATSVVQRRSILIVIFSINNLIDEQSVDEPETNTALDNLTTGLDVSVELPEGESKILLPSKKLSSIAPIEAHSIRDFWAKADTFDNIRDILERAANRRRDLHSLN
ncbi:MAG: hypothetical protein O3A80_03045 [bacterium]|nr:hypothetical protein [bacterium]MDA1292236.1 hypothetical protein [bacterium]